MTKKKSLVGYQEAIKKRPGTPVSQQAYEMGVLHTKIRKEYQPFTHWNAEQLLRYKEGYYSNANSTKTD